VAAHALDEAALLVERLVHARLSLANSASDLRISSR
jgi:hypothetical protein